MLKNFLVMGGYAHFVWPAFGCALFLMMIVWHVTHYQEMRQMLKVARVRKMDSDKE
jgi:heme exporter protein CcmD